MRVAVVVQRFGKDVLGGAETHAALMAGILAREHDVEVLTTTARDYHEWREGFPPGVEHVDGLRVRRFPVAQGRTPWWHATSRLLHDGFEPSSFASLPLEVRDAFAERVRAWPDALQEEFLRGQGPVAPELVEHLRQERHDRVLFVTYLYPTTYDGLLAVPRGRAFVVPTLHDEPPAYLPVVGRRLSRARLLCSTEAEVALVARLYPHDPPAASLLGYGIELPSARPAAPAFDDSSYLLYAGRVDPQKGISDLLGWYAALRRAMPRAPRLRLIGEVAMPLPRLPGLEPLGFVSEARKHELLRGALALVHPSPYESLGIVILEAMGAGVPIVVRADCEVLVEHCRRGRAGVWVRDAAEFTAAVGRLAGDPALCDRLGRAGRSFAEGEYGLAAYAERLLGWFRPSPGPGASPGDA
ncbi:MAG: glycosyltransferase family 4 protein [Alphaproteobacteria bacterium]